MRSPLLLPLLFGCGRYETGIDRTVLDGTLVIAPLGVTEAETAVGENDDVTLAQDLGPVAFQVVALTGTMLTAGNYRGDPTGDLDWYTFTPAQDGETYLSLVYPGVSGDIDPEDPPDEPVLMDVEIVDLSVLDDTGAPTTIYAGNTRGLYGDLELTLDLTGGDTYALRLAETHNSTDDQSYTLVLWGFDPTGTRFLVGAYAESDVASRGDPLGGTSVESFTLNPDTLAWEGAFEVLFIRSLVTTYDSDGNQTNVVDEAIPKVYLYGGDFSSLNAGILAGDTFSSVPTEVELSTDDATTDLHTDLFVTCDTIQPIQIGWTFAETEPNDVDIDFDTYNLAGDLTGANALPVSTGLGYVDLIDGSLTYTTADPGWADDKDVFALTVPSEMGATISLGWPDAAADVDLHLYDQDGVLIAAGWAVANSNPEIITTSDWGILFEPGQTYYIGVFGYAGAAGELPYDISIEYTGS